MSASLTSVTRPFDFLNGLVGKYIEVKCREGRSFKGVLNAFDDHLNMLVSNVEERGVGVDGGDEVERKIGVMYVRGDGIIGVSKVDEKEIEKVNIRDRITNPVMV